MGHEFGELAKIRGVITYKLSNHEQKAFTGIFSHSFFNVARRIRSNIFFVAPPFIIGYAIYDYGETKFKLNQRKNPKDFENDV